VTDAEKIAALIRYRLEQADEALAAAALNLANGLERSAINRAYYGMFYAVLALLAERTIETSRHSGAVAQFDLLYVKPQVILCRGAPGRRPSRRSSPRGCLY
jgi:uncharacterized protein (UPF0332 family)